MRYILTLTLLLGIAWGQSELRGTWINDGYSFTTIYNIYKSNGKQYIERKTIAKKALVGDSLLSEDVYILHEPWFGESYFEFKDRNNKTSKIEVTKIEVSLINTNTILIGTTKYRRK